MKFFSLFKNLFSKEASEVIGAEVLVENIRNGVYREAVERIRSLAAQGRKDEVSELKRNMKAVLFAGECKGGRSFARMTSMTGFAMFDFDGLTDAQMADAAAKLKTYPWVVMLFVTVSGSGLRVVVNIGKVEQGSFRRVYEAVADRLMEITDLKADMQCKDFARLSIVSYDPGIYYNPDAEVIKVAGPVVMENVMENVADGMNGMDGGGQSVDAATVVRRFFSKYPYVEGSRHSTLIFLGKYLRWCNLDVWQMDNAIADVCSFGTGNGMGEKEIEKAVRWGYDHGTVGNKVYLGSKVQHFGREMKFLAASQRHGVEMDEEAVIEANCKTVPERVYGKLPATLEKLLVLGKDKYERDMLLISSICMMSGIFSNLRTMYANKLYSPHLYLAVLARAGSGKGIVSNIMRLGTEIDRKLMERYAIEKRAYDEKSFAWEQEKKRAVKENRKIDMTLEPEEPVMVKLKTPPNMSKSQFILAMKAAERIGQIVYTSEIDAMSSALSTDYGKHLPEMRMAFHHEMIGQYYKVDAQPVIIENPMLSVLLTGTIEQFMKFVPNIHDGSFSRFMLYVCNRPVEWKSQSPLDGNGDVDADALVAEVDKRLSDYFFDEEGKRLMIHFTRSQWDKHKEVFSELLNIVAAECEDSMESVVTRCGLITMRIAMVLCGLRIMEAGWKTNDYTCSDEDFDTALDIALVCFKHSIQLSTVYVKDNTRKKMATFFQRLKVLKDLNEVFSFTEFVEKGISYGFSESSMKRTLKRYENSGIVEKTGGRYRKVKKLRDDLYGEKLYETP